MNKWNWKSNCVFFSSCFHSFCFNFIFEKSLCENPESIFSSSYYYFIKIMFLHSKKNKNFYLLLISIFSFCSIVIDWCKIIIKKYNNEAKHTHMDSLSKANEKLRKRRRRSHCTNLKWLWICFTFTL